MAHYLHTSALVKLVIAEVETPALRGWLAEGHRDFVASDLARTELMRAVRRGAPDRVLRARTVLDSVSLLRLDTTTYESAGRIDPENLRSLDALHLASALELGDELDAMVTYDDRLAEAARQNGVPVLAPR
ncbi:type II toxin-antitoxin system VapC family toxin [Pseudactinotalea terrae]|uniref:type II toxin-antitoxin system VapC family toxin n=1 Tax=Pseudactinotalea terrae TaxID=1743262 RepID=UPI0012E26936|nr:type II toxin-antitoxin system VapC family toxin [Pseudactinotalea terrae]